METIDNYENGAFDIDLSEIWSAQVNAFHQGQSAKEDCDLLYNFLKPLYLKKGHKPFICVEDVEKDPSLESYYKNYHTRLTLRSGDLIDFFEHGNAFYDMDVDFVIKPGDLSHSEYSKLFAFKLNQYHSLSEHELRQFLAFQWRYNYGGDVSKFNDFLDFVLKHNQHLLNKIVQEGIKSWMSFLSLVVPNNNSSPQKNETQTVEIEEINPDKLATLSSEDNRGEAGIFSNELSQLPVAIPGEMTLEEITHYFSFLYQKDEVSGTSFLEKEEVDEIFKKGIEIPAQPVARKFTLNSSRRFPKMIVHSFIYWFYRCYNIKRKSDILRFFGSYITDYAQALDHNGLQNLLKNITGTKTPKNKKYKPQDYLPDSLAKRTPDK